MFFLAARSHYIKGELLPAYWPVKPGSQKPAGSMSLVQEEDSWFKLGILLTAMKTTSMLLVPDQYDRYFSLQIVLTVPRKWSLCKISQHLGLLM